VRRIAARRLANRALLIALVPNTISPEHSLKTFCIVFYASAHPYRWGLRHYVFRLSVRLCVRAHVLTYINRPIFAGITVGLNMTSNDHIRKYADTIGTVLVLWAGHFQR